MKKKEDTLTAMTLFQIEESICILIQSIASAESVTGTPLTSF